MIVLQDLFINKNEYHTVMHMKYMHEHMNAFKCRNATITLVVLSLSNTSH